jgi:S-(hydroxymethyl)mycothiol dehydrogenase
VRLIALRRKMAAVSSAVLDARNAGAAQIVGVEVVDSRLDHARSISATHTVNIAHPDAVASIRELTGGAGADYAVEAAGRLETMKAVFRSVRDGAGCARCRQVRGESQPDHDVPLMVDLYLKNYLKLDALIA